MVLNGVQNIEVKINQSKNKYKSIKKNILHHKLDMTNMNFFINFYFIAYFNSERVQFKDTI